MSSLDPFLSLFDILISLPVIFNEMLVFKCHIKYSYVCQNYFNQFVLFLRYLIDSRWFKQWKKYVGFDSWDMYNVGERSLYPGPIDNSGLFSGKNWNFERNIHVLVSITVEKCIKLTKLE